MKIDVEAYRPVLNHLANSLMRRVHSPLMDKDDLVQEGFIGLLRAAKKFDPSKGLPFDVYARLQVVGAMRDALRMKVWGRNYNKSEELKDLHRRQKAIVEHLYTGRYEPSPEDAAKDAERADRIRAALITLPVREKKVLAMHYYAGIDLQDIAPCFDVGPSRVGQLHTAALGHMRSRLEGSL